MKKMLRNLIAGAMFALGLMLIGSAGAAIPYFTGPAGSNPVNFPAALSDFQALIAEINANIAQYFTMNNSSAELGELAFSNPNSFAVNGSVATVMSSAGPSGSHTAIQEWLTVVDPSGNVRYIPSW